MIGSRQGGGEGGQQSIQRGLHHIGEREDRAGDWAALDVDVSLMLEQNTTQ